MTGEWEKAEDRKNKISNMDIPPYGTEQESEEKEEGDRK